MSQPAPLIRNWFVIRGCSSMVERQLPKLHTRVRFPSPAFARSFLAGYSAAGSASLPKLLTCPTQRRKRRAVVPASAGRRRTSERRCQRMRPPIVSTRSTRSFLAGYSAAGSASLKTRSRSSRSENLSKTCKSQVTKRRDEKTILGPIEGTIGRLRFATEAFDMPYPKGESVAP